MKVLLLCAGLGTRLWPLTKDTPKPMIKVGGKPVLEHIIDHLKRFGLTEIIINTHYHPEVFMKHFGNRLLYSYEKELLGEEGTIRSLEPWIRNDFCLVMNGDTLTNIDINKMFGMCKGKNTKWMDGKVYAGTRIIAPFYGVDPIKSGEYRNPDYFWIDIGTPSGLKRAREAYGE